MVCVIKGIQHQLIFMTRTTTHILVTMLDVKVNLAGDFRTLGSLNRLRAEECGNGDQEESKREPAKYHGGFEKRSVERILVERGRRVTVGSR